MGYLHVLLVLLLQ